MKMLFVIATIVAVVMLSANVLATYVPTAIGHVTIEERICGINVDLGSPIEFGTMIMDPTNPTILPTGSPGYATVVIDNPGNTGIANLEVSGTDWTGTNPVHTMPVGQTDIADDGTNCSPWTCTLPSTPGTIFGGVLASGATPNVFFRLTVPAAQTPDTYSQEITFTGSC
jgi:hypothetical protein